jgi:hypothetical protein
MQLNPNTLSDIQKDIKTGRILGLTMGLLFLGFSLYAYSLSIKANKLSIKKLKDEGYE